MIMAVDIDQFFIVKCIGMYQRSDGFVRVISKYCHIFDRISYIIKELFNMRQINMINFCSFSQNYLYYNSESAAINHSSCRWNNLVNIQYVYSIDDSINPFERSGLIKKN